MFILGSLLETVLKTSTIVFIKTCGSVSTSFLIIFLAISTLISNISGAIYSKTSFAACIKAVISFLNSAISASACSSPFRYPSSNADFLMVSASS